MLKKQIENVNKDRSNSLYNDIESSHAKHRIQKELTKIQKLKNVLLTNITELKAKNNHISLILDKILFDNIILLDKVFKNLELMEQL